MKPRIKIYDGIWQCIGKGVWGLGYTPKHAFDLWWSEVLRRG